MNAGKAKKSDFLKEILNFWNMLTTQLTGVQQAVMPDQETVEFEIRRFYFDYSCIVWN